MRALTKIGPMYAYPALLDTKFKVTGYENGTAVNLAMERGEVQGRGSNPWSSWKATSADWIEAGRSFRSCRSGSRRMPSYPDMPLLNDLGQNEEQRRIFAFVSCEAIDHPSAAPPGLNPDVLP